MGITLSSNSYGKAVNLANRYDWGVYIVPYRALSSLGQLDVSKQINVT